MGERGSERGRERECEVAVIMMHFSYVGEKS